jgi:catechol 2,3-dioxygenase-like lactoylglutathione lyase family enzyme
LSPITGIDHLIITVGDLQAATSLYGEALGFHVSGGGTHPRFGTENRIILLEDEYIELLGAQAGAEPGGLVGNLLRQGEGCAGCILGVHDAATAASEMRSRGMSIDGPTAGRLEAGPEFSRGWSTLTPLEPEIPGVPFFIAHDTQGEERRRLLAGRLGPSAHPLGARRVESVTIAVNNRAKTADIFEQMLQLAADNEYHDPMLAAHCIRIPLPSGAGIILAMPEPAAGGPIAATLSMRGEGLFAVTIAVDELPMAVRTLRARGIGVRVDEPDGVLVAAQLNHRNLMGARIGLTQAR